MIRTDDSEWLVKFPSSADLPEIGIMEKRYTDCAGECGIQTVENRLFSSEYCNGYFGSKRFDREYDKTGSEKRIHMQSVSALLELDYRAPSLDYHSLLKLTTVLTNDMHQKEEMFRRTCFNVFAHNRDDHSNNFTFLYNDKEDKWYLSPACDLTYSTTYYGEHTTTVDGNGKDPGEKELLAVGKQAGLAPRRCREIIEDIHRKVSRDLTEYIRS